jgi:hypothetical protein
MDVTQIILRKHQKDFTGNRVFRKSVIEDYLLQLLSNHKLTGEEYERLSAMNNSPDKENRYIVQQIIYTKL